MEVQSHSFVFGIFRDYLIVFLGPAPFCIKMITKLCDSGYYIFRKRNSQTQKEDEKLYEVGREWEMGQRVPTSLSNHIHLLLPIFFVLSRPSEWEIKIHCCFDYVSLITNTLGISFCIFIGDLHILSEKYQSKAFV